jgi:predicted metalloprotease with PDZ domain
VRLSRVIDVDIHQLEFDFDLTMMTFFLSPEGQVYSRYGGRDSKDSETRLSLAGFRHTLESVLAEHAKKTPLFAERTVEKPQYPRDMNIAKRGCVHCHNVKERQEIDLAKAGKWTRDLVWRYPPPDNIGLIPDVDRGNVVKTVMPESPAAKAGLKPGDQLRSLNRVPIHSFGDALFALDRAPAKGAIDVAWERDGQAMSAKLELSEGWKKTDITWRASQRHRVPVLSLYGDDLTADEKKQLGLRPDQLAFRQRQEVSAHATKAGFKAGDVILGIDGQEPNTTMSPFLSFVRRNYLAGDRVRVIVFRDGRRIEIQMTLIQL